MDLANWDSGLHRNSPHGLNISSLRISDQIRDLEIPDNNLHPSNTWERTRVVQPVINTLPFELLGPLGGSPGDVSEEPMA